MSSELDPWSKSGQRGVMVANCLISTPAGYLDVNDHVRYELEAGTMESTSVSMCV